MNADVVTVLLRYKQSTSTNVMAASLNLQFAHMKTNSLTIFFLKQIIIFINVLVSFTDAGKLLLNLISHNDTVAASPTGTLLKEKG